MRRLVVSLGAVVALLLSGCAEYDIMRRAQLSDVTGEWVLDEEGGSGRAQLTFFRSGRFEATGWPSNLMLGEDSAQSLDELDWETPVDLAGEWYPDGGSGSSVGDGTIQLWGDGRPDPLVALGVMLARSEGPLWDSEYVDEEMRFYLRGFDDEYNYAAFVHEDGSSGSK